MSGPTYDHVAKRLLDAGADPAAVRRAILILKRGHDPAPVTIDEIDPEDERRRLRAANAAAKADDPATRTHRLQLAADRRFRQWTRDQMAIHRRETSINDMVGLATIYPEKGYR